MEKSEVLENALALKCSQCGGKIVKFEDIECCTWLYCQDCEAPLLDDYGLGSLEYNDLVRKFRVAFRLLASIYA